MIKQFFEKDIIIDKIDKLKKIYYKPLQINTLNDYSSIKNIILIDSNVQEYNIFSNSVNNQTLSIVYSQSSNRDELLGFIQSNFKSIERVGLVFNDANIDSKLFLNKELFYTKSDLELNQTVFSSNMIFLIELIRNFQVTNIDFLVCGGLQYDSWRQYFNILNKETEVIEKQKE